VEVERKAGGLILCDEVQPGFGRMGSHFWGHDRMGFAPDVVTMGKPMANGHPVAAAVARAEVMAAFRGAFGYFNTFGGNPVSCAAAMAVLEVIEAEGLQSHAADVAGHMLGLLRSLDHPLVADVRGAGLFFGVELVREGRPATDDAARVVEAMKCRGVLMGRIGRHQHILKIRPPLPFSRDNADFAVQMLAEALAEIPA
jgi:4-aminobutyrate aminotransferase-like enzyme